MNEVFAEKKTITFIKEGTGFLGSVKKIFSIKKIVKSLKVLKLINLKAENSNIHHQPFIYERSIQYQAEFTKAQVLDWYYRQRAKIM